MSEPLSTHQLGDRYFHLRHYPHLGKYEGGLQIDPFVDRAENFDESAGDVGGLGHYGLVRGPFTDEDFVFARLDDVSTDWDLTPDEREFLKAVAGAIIRTDSQGFVHVDYYDGEESLEKAWAEVAEFYAQGGE